MRLIRGMESYYTGGYKSPAKQKRRGDVLAAYKYIQRVNTREAEELFKLEESVGVGTNGCEFIQFSLGGLSRGSGTASHRRRVREY